MAREPREYDAFLSYTPAAETVPAQALHAELADFVRPRLALFRDDGAADPADALAGSAWFILMASPEAAASARVADEVAWWNRHKPRGRMLIALTGGELVWAGDDFDPARSTALPPGLAGTFDTEPPRIDLRQLRPDPSWLPGGRTAAGSVPQGPAPSRAGRCPGFEDTPPPRLGDLVARLAAPILGRPAGVLIAANLRRRHGRRRRGRAAIAALTVLLLIAAGGVLVALHQRDQAREQVRAATSRALAGQSRQLPAAETDTALLLAAESYRTMPTNQAREALLGLLTSRTQVVAYLRGHRAPVSAVAMSPDGALVASGDRSGAVNLWPAEPAGRPTPLTGPGGPIARLAFTPDARTIVAAGASAIALTPVASPGAPPTLLRFGEFGVRALAVSPDSRRLAAAGCRLVDDYCSDGLLKVWDLGSGTSVLDRRLFTVAAATSVAFSPDAATVAVGSAQGAIVQVRLADAAVSGLTTPAVQHPDQVDRLVYRADGRRLTSSSGTATPVIRVWDPLRSRPIYAPGGGLAAVTIGDDHAVRLWRAGVGTPATTLSGHHATVEQVAWSTDEQLLVSGDDSGVVIVWRRSADGPLHRRRPAGKAPAGITFSPDGKRLAVSGADGIGIWERDTGVRVALLRPVPGNGFDRIAFSPDGTTVAAAGLDGVGLWDAGTGRLRRPLAPLGTDLAFAPDGAWVAVGGGDGPVSLVNPLTGAVVSALDVGPARAVSVAVSHDGRTLAAGTDDGRVRLGEPASWASARDLRLTGDVSALTFSPDDRWLATIGPDGLGLWDARTGVDALSIPDVTAAAFSPDGATLVAAYADGRLALWDVATHRLLVGPVTGLVTGVSGLAVDPTGFRVALTDRSGVLLIDLAVASWPVLACAIAARDLTTAEWSTLVGDRPYHRTCTSGG